MVEELSSLATLAPKEVFFLASPITVIIIVSKATQPITIPAIAPLLNHREPLPPSDESSLWIGSFPAPLGSVKLAGLRLTKDLSLIVQANPVEFGNVLAILNKIFLFWSKTILETIMIWEGKKASLF